MKMTDFVKLLKADGCSWSCGTISMELIIVAAAVPLDEELVWGLFFFGGYVCKMDFEIEFIICCCNQILHGCTAYTRWWV